MKNNALFDLEKYRYAIDLFKINFNNSNFSRPFSFFDDKKQVVVKFEKSFNLQVEHDKQNADWFYHPCTIAQAALAYYDILLDDKNEKVEELFWAQINWLCNNGVSYKNALVYPFPFAVKTFGVKPNWISGMYQGHILSCFVRAYVLSGDERYMDLADKVYNSYALELGDKYGFRVRDEYGLWFEEAMLEPATHIFNGFVFAVFGLIDYYNLTGRSDVKVDMDESLLTLKNVVGKYDMGFWSYYDLAGKIASYNYHNVVHIKLLEALYKITGEVLYLNIAQRWKRYGTHPYFKLRKKIFSFKSMFFKR